MSKTMLVLILAAGVGIAVSRRQPADPAAAANAGGAATTAEAGHAGVNKPSFLGKVGVRLVERPVHRMSANTQQILNALKPALKKTGGAPGRRAAEAAAKAAALDQQSLEALKNAQPIKAVRAAFDARNYANVSKGILGVELAGNGP